MDIKRYLKTKDPKLKSIVLMTFHANGNKYKISSGITVKVRDWSFERQLLKAGAENALEVNHKLKELSAQISGIFMDSKLEGIEFNREYLDRKLNKRRNGNKSFLEEFENWISGSKGKKTESTINAYLSILKVLHEYQRRTSHPLTFESIGRKFYEDYTSYLKQRGNFNNGIGNHFKTIKAFMNEMTERGINTNLEFRKKYFRSVKEPAEIIALNLDELKQMEDLELEGRLERVRDLFILEAFTGLRYIDVVNLKIENPDANHILVPIIKTKTSHKVTINSHARNVLKKYHDKALSTVRLPRISNSAMNSSLKEIGKILSWDSGVTHVKYQGAVRHESQKMKWEMITTHTARRSFVTNALELGIAPTLVMEMVGHRKMETMKRYIKHSEKAIEEASRLFDLI